MKKRYYSDEIIKELIEQNQQNELTEILYDVDLFNGTIVDMGANEDLFEIVQKSAKEGNSVFKKEITVLKNITEKEDGSVELRGLLIKYLEPYGYVDAHGSVFPKKEIEKALETLMKNGRTAIDVQHDEVFTDEKNQIKAFIKTADLVKEGDPDYGPEYIGSLVVTIKVLNENLAKDILKGKYKGLSIYGQSKVQPIKISDYRKSLKQKLNSSFEKIMSDIFGVSEDLSLIEKQNEELTMAEIQDILDAINNGFAAINEKFDSLNPVDEAPKDENADDTPTDEVNKDENQDMEKAFEKANEELKTEVADLKKSLADVQVDLAKANETIDSLENQVKDFGKGNGQDRTSGDVQIQPQLFK